jgi:hypothetical protein
VVAGIVGKNGLFLGLSALVHPEIAEKPGEFAGLGDEFWGNPGNLRDFRVAFFDEQTLIITSTLTDG